ncbi:MAG: hypothetical protein AB8B63_01335 [Granulosicoccus sp.]
MILLPREYWECLAVFAVWLVSGFAAGLLGAGFGGGASLLLGVHLGVCGATLHLILWAVERYPHWFWAGPVFGFITTCSIILLNLEEGVHEWWPIPMLPIFLILSLLSCLIYPIASLVIRKPSLTAD